MSKTIEEQIAVMKAFADGKEIECSDFDDCWVDCNNPNWNWHDCDYRIKKEKNFRPYKNTQELIDDFNKKFADSLPLGGVVACSELMLPSIWVKPKIARYPMSLITQFNEFNIAVNTARIDMNCLFNNYTFLDNSPCGVKE